MIKTVYECDVCFKEVGEPELYSINAFSSEIGDKTLFHICEKCLRMMIDNQFISTSRINDVLEDQCT